MILRLRIGDAIMVVKEIELPDDAEVTLKVVSDPAPVSYTHLDVYKRQGMYGENTVFPV